jgi:hypothetical protein
VDDRVVELRVHGVSGTSPEEMLDDPWPEQVAGDDVARFLRSRAGTTARRARTVEALHWGRFTAGSPTRALWLLLAPFALLNLAHYALLPPRAGRRGQQLAARVARALIRLLGLALTLTLAVSVATATLDLVMNQCAGAARCVADRGWLRPLAFESEGARFLLGALVPSLVVVLLWWFGRQTFLYSRPELDRRGKRTNDWGDPLFWRARELTDLLRDAHVGAYCATLGMLFVGFLDRPRIDAVELLPVTGTVARVAGGALLLVCTVVVLWPRLAFWHTPRSDVLKWSAVAYLGAVVLTCAGSTWTARPIVPDRAGEPLPGFELAGVVANLAMAVLVFLLVLPCLWLRRGQPRRRTSVTSGPRVADADEEGPDLPTPFRPVFGGFGALVLASLSAALAVGFSAGVTFWTARLVGVPTGDAGVPVDSAAGWGIHLGPSWWAGAMLWGWTTIVVLLVLPAVVALVLRAPVLVATLLWAAATAVALSFLVGPTVRGPGPWLGVAAVLLGAVGVAFWVVAMRRDRILQAVRASYRPDPNEPARTSTSDVQDAIPRIAMQCRLARSRDRLHWVLGTVSVLAVAASSGYVLLTVAFPEFRGYASLPSGAFGSTVITFLAAVFITLGLRSWRNQKARTAVGVLWDLLAFWPRVAHPLCPPPYGGRTTLELVERANYLAHRPGNQAVVLSGHSQGSLVCFAAMAVLVRESRTEDTGSELLPMADAKATLDKICLVTYGSQLQWGYARLFPAYVGQTQLAAIYGNPRLGGRWRNLYRWTDPLGGRVLSWRTEGSPAPPLEKGIDRFPLPPGPSVDPKDEPDVLLRDPASVARTQERPRSPLRAHSGYYDDPEFDGIVDELADRVRRPFVGPAGGGRSDDADPDPPPTRTAPAASMS